MEEREWSSAKENQVSTPGTSAGFQGVSQVEEQASTRRSRQGAVGVQRPVSDERVHRASQEVAGEMDLQGLEGLERQKQVTGPWVKKKCT